MNKVMHASELKICFHKASYYSKENENIIFKFVDL